MPTALSVLEDWLQQSIRSIHHTSTPPPPQMKPGYPDNGPLPSKLSQHTCIILSITALSGVAFDTTSCVKITNEDNELIDN